MLIGSYLGFESYFHYVPMSYFGWQGPRLSKATSWLTWVSHLCSWHWSECLKASLIKYLGYLKYLKIDSNCLWYYSICISVKKCTCGHQSLSSGLLKLKIKNGIEIIGVKEKKKKRKEKREVEVMRKIHELIMWIVYGLKELTMSDGSCMNLVQRKVNFQTLDLFLVEIYLC